MTINRRRAPSSSISSEKKKSGHRSEDYYASLVEGEVMKGTQKGDVKDSLDFFYSVKTGKKWQIFLYSHDRIVKSKHLRILGESLEAFPVNAEKYFIDRTLCIEYQEEYVKKHGREKAKNHPNSEVVRALGLNSYIDSKENLAKATEVVCSKLKDKGLLRHFLGEAIFNNDEVHFLAIRDTTYLRDDVFKVFAREDVLDILTANLYPSVSKAGLVAVDFNVAGQKTLLCYDKNNKQKNIVEIEIRNDSEIHYRQARFNMYSRDALALLTEGLADSKILRPKKDLVIYGSAVQLLT